MPEISDFRSLLQSVSQQWQQSAKAYAEYMENGKKFRYAENMKLYNTSVKDMLIDSMDMIPEAFKRDVEEIIEHYAIWSTKWNDLKSKMNPAPDDEFVFENAHRFPKNASLRLEEALQKMN